jgi:hypothetical protein
MKNVVKIWILLTIVFMGSNTAMGIKVDISKAQKVANNFLKNVGGETSSLTLVYSRGDAYYVFGTSQSFVIVAGDDRVNPILGYSKEGPWVDPSSQSDPSFASNFWGMMDNFEKQIKSSKQQVVTTDPEMSRKWQSLESGQILKSAITPVKPLLTTKWDQGWPYNALCPEDPDGPGGHVQVGCVGVAMAQIMKYHNYPEKGLGKMGYKHSVYPYTEADFGSTTYKWSDMPDSIGEVNNSIATLMYHCAVSVVSNWGPGETSAISGIGEDDVVARNLIKNFKYAYSSMRSIGSWEYTSVQWDSILYTELVNKRPIYYSGSGTGGHSFVCDGVDVNNFYHFNFGWGGQYNGYYALSTISPGSRNYSQNQIAIIGIKPNDGSTIVENITWKGNMTLSTNVVIAEDITLTVEAGSEIKFAKDCRLTVWGNVLSMGKEDHYVRFTSLDTLNRWNGIRFLLYNTKENVSKFVYTQIEYSKNHGVLINGFGGGHGEIIFDYCKINNNYGGGKEYDGSSYYRSGGGISAYYLLASEMTITNSEIYHNKSDDVGGGIFIEKGSDVKIANSKIWGNSAVPGGGVGIHSSNVLFTNNEIYSNNGGAMYISHSSCAILNNKICNNSVSGSMGGGLSIFWDKKSTVVGNLVSNNNNGGLYFVNSDSSYIINNTIVNNIGIITNISSTPVFKNNIIYGNIKNWWETEKEDPYQDSPDPLFVRPSAGVGVNYDGLSADWTLRPESPYINTGDTVGIGHLLPAFDLAGNPRIYGKIDMGAYENQLINTLSYTHLSDQDFLIYPNPCRGKCSIKSSQALSGVSLYDIWGRLIYQVSTNRDQTLTLDLSHLIPGIYFVHTDISGGQMVIRKLIVQ